MLGKGNEHIVASTPAVLGLHIVDQFHGQSSPEISTMELKDVDQPLLEALLVRWDRYYLNKEDV